MRFIGNIGKFLVYGSNENVEGSREPMCSLNFTHHINPRQFTIVHHAWFNITYNGYKKYLRILLFFNGAFFFLSNSIHFILTVSNFSVIWKYWPLPSQQYTRCIVENSSLENGSSNGFSSLRTIIRSFEAVFRSVQCVELNRPRSAIR